jgi:hypothetical protein
MGSSNLNFFENLKIREGWGIGVFVKYSIFQKCPKFILPQNKDLLSVIYNISVSEGVNIPIYGDSFISQKF